MSKLSEWCSLPVHRRQFDSQVTIMELAAALKEADERLVALEENLRRTRGTETISVSTEYDLKIIRDDPTPSPVQAIWQAMTENETDA